MSAEHRYNEVRPRITQNEGRRQTATELWAQLINGQREITNSYGVPSDDDTCTYKEILCDRVYPIRIPDGHVITAYLYRKSNNGKGFVDVFGGVHENYITFESKTAGPSITCTYDVYVFSRLPNEPETSETSILLGTNNPCVTFDRSGSDLDGTRATMWILRLRSCFRSIRRKYFRPYKRVILCVIGIIAVIVLIIILATKLPSTSTTESGGTTEKTVQKPLPPTKPPTTESGGTFPYMKAVNPHPNCYFKPLKWYNVTPNAKSVYEDILNGRDAEIYHPPINVTRCLNPSIHGKETLLVFKWRFKNNTFSLCCPTYHPNMTFNFNTVLRLRVQLDLQLPLKNSPENKLLFHTIYDVSAAYQHGVCKTCKNFSETANMETSGNGVGFAVFVKEIF